MCLLDLAEGSVSILSWESRKTRRVTYSTVHAEITALLAAVTCALWIKEFFIEQFGVSLPIGVSTDAKSVVFNLETTNEPNEKYLRHPLNCLRAHLATDELRQVKWCRGQWNMADALTKRGALESSRLLRTALVSEKFCDQLSQIGECNLRSISDL